MTVDSSTQTARPVSRNAGVARTPAPSSELGPWARSAACRSADPGLFFGSDQERGAAREERESEALAVCRSCAVVDSCRAWAMAHPSWASSGIWGNTTEDERKTGRRRQQRDRLRQAGASS